MSRSGYVDDDYGIESNWPHIRYRGMIASATRGRRGQALFRDLVAALDAMPEKRLVTNEIETKRGDVCALGAVGRLRGVKNMRSLDPEDPEAVAAKFDIADCLAREIVWHNDEIDGNHRITVNCTRCWGVAGNTRCFRCYGKGVHETFRSDTPEERWQRMRDWAASQITGGA